MKFLTDSLAFGLKVCSVLVVGLLCVGALRAQDKTAGDDQPSAKSDKTSEQPMVRLRVQVKDSNDKAVTNASVYVRYDKPGGFLHKDKLAELDLKTNGEGSVKVPPVPQGKILIQVIATGWHTYGKWYDVNKDEESIDIKLEPPAHWY